MTKRMENNEETDYGEWPGPAAMHLAWECLLSGVRFTFLYGAFRLFSGKNGHDHIGIIGAAGLAIVCFLAGIAILLFVLESRLCEESPSGESFKWTWPDELKLRSGSIAIDGLLLVIIPSIYLFGFHGNAPPMPWFFGLVIMGTVLIAARDVVMWFWLPKNLREKGYKWPSFSRDRTRRARIIRRASYAGIFVGLAAFISIIKWGDRLPDLLNITVIFGSIFLVAGSIIVWRMEHGGKFG